MFRISAHSSVRGSVLRFQRTSIDAISRPQLDRAVAITSFTATTKSSMSSLSSPSTATSRRIDARNAERAARSTG